MNEDKTVNIAALQRYLLKYSIHVPDYNNVFLNISSILVSCTKSLPWI